MSGWKFIVEAKCSSRTNMERDLSLFSEVRRGRLEGFFRLYDWDEPAVTTGHHQKHFSLFDTSLTLPIIPRPTGGGAVLHEHDITFSLGVPETGAFSRGITESYVRVSKIFARVLQSTGLDVRMEGESSRFSPVCFARSAPVELVLQGRKIMGLALLRSEGYLLFQGVLPLHVDTSLAGRVFEPEQAGNSLGILDMMPDFRAEFFIECLVEAFASGMKIPLPLERHQYDTNRHHRDEGKIHTG